MKEFIEKVKKICENNNKVAMFIDMDGTINEYTVYAEKNTKKNIEDNYLTVKPIEIVIDELEEINKIPNIDLYILSLSKSQKITEQKNIWLEQNTNFIPKENWIILTKETGGYNSENRDVIKPMKMKEKLENYNQVIFLDDDHKILKKAIEILQDKVDAFHVSSAFI